MYTKRNERMFGIKRWTSSFQVEAVDGVGYCAGLPHNLLIVQSGVIYAARRPSAGTDHVPESCFIFVWRRSVIAQCAVRKKIDFDFETLLEIVKYE
jgi:hypothetical protein